MNEIKILQQAVLIAQGARAQADRADFEATVQSFEQSDDRTMRSLARAYRMLQRPPG